MGTNLQNLKVSTKGLQIIKMNRIYQDNCQSKVKRGHSRYHNFLTFELLIWPQFSIRKSPHTSHAHVQISGRYYERNGSYTFFVDRGKISGRSNKRHPNVQIYTGQNTSNLNFFCLGSMKTINYVSVQTWLKITSYTKIYYFIYLQIYF